MIELTYTRQKDGTVQALGRMGQEPTLEELQGKNEFHAKKQFSVCCSDVDIPEFKLRALRP